MVSSTRTYVLEYGLTRADLSLVRATIPNVNRVVLCVRWPIRCRGAARGCPAVFGTEPAFFRHPPHQDRPRPAPFSWSMKRRPRRYASSETSVAAQVVSLTRIPLGKQSMLTDRPTSSLPTKW